MVTVANSFIHELRPFYVFNEGNYFLANSWVLRNDFVILFSWGWRNEI